MEVKSMENQTIDGAIFKKMFVEAANYLEKNKRIVDDLNVFPVPDGDTGTNMSLTIHYAIEELKSADETDVSKLAALVSSGALMGARGNSGVILSQLFRGFSKGCKGKATLGVEEFAKALKSASEMAYKAVMKPTEGTILTVARGMGEFAMEHYEEYDSMDVFLLDTIKEAEKVLDRTPDMLAVLKEAGVVDAGGMGLVYIYKGMYNGLTGRETVAEEQSSIDFEKPIEDDIHSEADITFGYCTEFIIIGENKDSDRERLKEEYNKMGDSIIVVGDEQKIKVHLHTDQPDQAMKLALEIGSLTRIKIDNMREQVKSKSEKKPSSKEPMKDYGIIAVSPGEGLTELFKDIGVDEVITGGQTMNPSTQDFVDCIKKIHAKTIVILPNNSNIILAANQSKNLTDKEVLVIESKTVPQGITALISFDPQAEAAENEENMRDALEDVKTGQITYAVRDTTLNGTTVKKDDIIGLFDGKIVCVGKDPSQVCLDLIDQMTDDLSELISIYYGQDIEEEKAESTVQSIEEKYEDYDVELHYGGQPLYYYIVSVE
ncbi:MAG TPA: dihydroxyacetone kinase [Eubacteriaceae bacterium]|nr:dihydroxyacetone kinase [Eubacteriaceae bacterium]